MTFSANQKRAARTILAASGWVVPARISALVSLVNASHILPQVNALASHLDTLDTLESDLKRLASMARATGNLECLTTGTLTEMSAVESINTAREKILANPLAFAPVPDNVPVGNGMEQAIYGFTDNSPA